MVDAVGTTKYTYANGLLATEDGPWANDTVAWDYNTARKRSALRLQQTASHWWTSSSSWDASHRLVDWYPTSTERFVYDGMLLVQERNTSAPTVSYTRGVDLSGGLDGAGGIGGLLARSHGFSSGSGTWSTHSAYHADGNGNVTGLYSTSTGSQVGWYRYDAFGRLLQSSGTLASANRMRFSSKPWMAPGVDASAGLYYYGYRFYDPNTQRWVNRDPLLGSRTYSGPPYAMANNAIPHTVDAMGLFALVVYPYIPRPPSVDAAVSWLNKCKPNICPGGIGNRPIVHFPFGEGSAVIPVVVGIDFISNDNSTIAGAVNTIAHECLHKWSILLGHLPYAIRDNLIELALERLTGRNYESYHDAIYQMSEAIEDEYRKDPEGVKCASGPGCTP